MLILEIAAGIMLAVVLLAVPIGVIMSVGRKKERDKRIAREWAARAKFEYHKFWTDELNKLSSVEEVLKVADGRSAIPDYSGAILEWAGRVTVENEKFWEYVNEKLANPATRAYYTHPKMRTADEEAKIAAHPNPALDSDALAARFAIEARAAANLAIVAGAS